MKSDLTHYHNSSIPLKKIVYFPEKNPNELSNLKLKRSKKNFLYFKKVAD